MSRIFRTIALAGVVAALVAPAASAKFIPGVTDAPSRSAEIVALREAETRTFIPGVTDVPSRSAEMVALRNGDGDSGTSVSSWSALGAGTIAAVLVAAAGGMLIARRRMSLAHA